MQKANRMLSSLESSVPLTARHFLYVDNDTCLSSKRNRTYFINAYEGIPETLLFNVLAYVFLLLLFAILRNRAWDYGRLALVQSDKWTHIFYGNMEDAVAAEENSETSPTDTGFFGWFPAIFKISTERIFARCGPDGSHYLSFQRHLLLLTLLIMAFSLGVILPINFQGTLQGDATTFGHTTISNLEVKSQWFWIHIIVCFTFVPLTIIIMRRCSSRIPILTQLSSRTIMVTHISHAHRNVHDIYGYFSLLYQNMDIKDVQLAYDVAQLMRVETERECAQDARLYCEVNMRDNVQVQPKGCAICCPIRTMEALEYYSEEEVRLTEAAEKLREKSIQNPLGIAFVTLDTAENANHIIDNFKPGTRRKWMVSKAPATSDIYWQNLGISTRYWYLRAVLVNLFLLIIFLFLTTPVVIVNLLNTFTTAQENFLKKLSPLASEFLPTLLLLTISALMPVTVYYSEEWLSHWTKSKQNQYVMQKTFYYLLFMVLILPSLGLTSAEAFIQWTFQTNNQTSVRWECVFLPDKGAFFVNYVITSALIGTALELLRFPELAMYLYRILRAKSKAEKVSIQKNILTEFPFGIHYSWTLLIFTTTVVYSLICPLVTPFGFLYLMLKHFVDKHNLYFVYRPSHMCIEGRQIHSTAVWNVRIAVILLQAILAAFTVIREGGGFNAKSIVTILGLAATCLMFFAISPFPSCKPTATAIVLRNVLERNETYKAPCLMEPRPLVVVPPEVEGPANSSPRYGSSDVCVRMSSASVTIHDVAS